MSPGWREKIVRPEILWLSGRKLGVIQQQVTMNETERSWLSSNYGRKAVIKGDFSIWKVL